MEVKIFWKESCEKCPGCPEAKELAKKLEKEKIKINLIDAESEDGIFSAENYQIFITPTILVIREDNGAVINSWDSELPSIEDIKYYLSI